MYEIVVDMDEETVKILRETLNVPVVSMEEVKSKKKRAVKLVRGVEANRVLKKTLPIVFAKESLYDLIEDPNNVYYRVYKGRDGYAVLYIFEWDKQFFPPHKHDYEPLIVITDKRMNPREIYVDGGHYFISKTELPADSKRYYIKIDDTWRSFTVTTKEPTDGYVGIAPLSYKTGKMVNFTYASNTILESLKSRSENPLKINDKILNNPFTVRNAVHWETYREPTLKDLAEDFAKNYGISFRSISQFFRELKNSLQEIIRRLTGRKKVRRKPKELYNIN